jgi:superfamily II DNA or RNA helicase
MAMRKKIEAVLNRQLIIPESRLPNSALRMLKEQFTRPNPKFHKAQNMGFYVGNIPREIQSYEREDGLLLLPRGSIDQVRVILSENDLELEIYDDTILHDPIDLEFQGQLRGYQEPAVADLAAACADDRFRGGVLRGPPGCGKTVLLLAAIAKLNRPAIVIVHNTILHRQWRSAVAKWLGFEPGNIGGGRERRIKSVTIAMQQSLWRAAKDKKDIGWTRNFSVVCVDEAHRAAARTYQSVSRLFPARYFMAVSADERRKDGLEFLVTETFGPICHEINKSNLEQLGNLVPVRMIVKPTDYCDDDYVELVANNTQPDWVSMITNLTQDKRRNQLIVSVVEDILSDSRHNRVLILSDRVEACRYLSQSIPNSGVMLGGVKNKTELQKTIAGLQSGKMRVGIGTTVADEGMDIPALTHVVLTCPVHSHPKRLEQMIGRTARPFKGKKFGTAIYIWDRLLFPPWPIDDPKRKQGEKNLLNKLRRVVPDLVIDE